MCGLTGAMSSFLSDSEVGTLKKLLLISSLRGLDSTGGISIQKTPGGDNANAFMRKRAVDPTGFITQPGFHQDLFFGQPDLNNQKQIIRGIALHNRLATVGAVSHENAHPFRAGGIIGMHNGTIAGEFEGREENKTDSEALMKLIDTKGIEEALKIVNNNMGSSYALCYFDEDLRTLNFIKNDSRPLCFAKTYGGTVYWASERAMLEFVLKREGVHVNKYFEPKKNVLISWNVGAKIWQDEPRELKLTVEKVYIPFVQKGVNDGVPWHQEDLGYDLVEGKKEKVDSCRVQNTSFARKNTTIQNILPSPSTLVMEYPPLAGTPMSRVKNINVSDTKNSAVEKKEEPAKSNQSSFSMYKGYQGQNYSETAIKSILSDGCVYCGTIPTLSQFHILGLKWYDEDTFLCDDCSKSPGLKDYLYDKATRDDLRNYREKNKKKNSKGVTIN